MAAVATADSVRCELLAETVRAHGHARLRVQGTSMLPSLWPGDVLQVERRRPEQLRAGAIILYRRDGRLFAHRLLKTDARGLLTRGDRLPHPDPVVPPEELLGEVTCVEREGRSFAPARRPGWAAALLRLASRFSDLPAGLLLRFGRSGASAGLPEPLPETDSSR